ncbi:MAG: glutamine-hydrolyzing carbamoyl-phosphate synthase small subunit [Elusimicrobiota bacterium]
MKAVILLEDGTILTGESFGAKGETTGEVVFNTSMSGYQEILTDPSYKGQIVMMTYPLIGNYGVNTEDVESNKVYVEGFVVKELSRVMSNWRSKMSLEEYLEKNKIIAIEGIDTRMITRRIRTKGALKGIISTIDDDPKSLEKKLESAPGLVGRDMVKEVSIKKTYKWNTDGKYHVVVFDCGVKHNILRKLQESGCRVTVVPVLATAEEVFELKPDGVVLSNGPGDPEGLPYLARQVSVMIEKNRKGEMYLPIFGICLGHQMLGLGFKGKTYKLKFGHHGGNHPVKDLVTNKVCITSQNHGFCVDIKSIPDKDVMLTHLNLYDKTNEGMKHTKLPIFSVQYHPEASPGPHDSAYLFKQFIDLMEKK